MTTAWMQHQMRRPVTLCRFQRMPEHCRLVIVYYLMCMRPIAGSLLVATMNIGRNLTSWATSLDLYGTAHVNLILRMVCNCTQAQAGR
jgi:hypothetical protein